MTKQSPVSHTSKVIWYGIGSWIQVWIQVMMLQFCTLVVAKKGGSILVYLIPVPVEYISTNNFMNVEYRNTINDLFANLLHIEERDEEPTQKEIDKMFVIPTPHCNHCKGKAPIILMKARSINGQLCGRPLLCLFDSGSTGCLF